MRLTVCQLPDSTAALESAWAELSRHTAGSDIVVLPEMPFHPWPAWTNEFDQAVWDAAVEDHVAWSGRLGDLGASVVVASAPVGHSDGERRNRAFLWDRGSVTYGHDKYYLPEEPGFWEASWYSRGDGEFKAVDCSGSRAGFLLCTEMWFTDHARAYARDGAHFLFTPRVTESATGDKWIAGGRAAAIMSGAFSASSNRSGSNNGVDFAGMGWVIDPDGEVLGVTSESQPFLTVEVDTSVADRAKGTYPRYVEE